MSLICFLMHLKMRRAHLCYNANAQLIPSSYMHNLKETFGKMRTLFLNELRTDLIKKGFVIL